MKRAVGSMLDDQNAARKQQFSGGDESGDRVGLFHFERRIREDDIVLLCAMIKVTEHIGADGSQSFDLQLCSRFFDEAHATCMLIDARDIAAAAGSELIADASRAAEEVENADRFLVIMVVEDVEECCLRKIGRRPDRQISRCEDIPATEISAYDSHSGKLKSE